MAEDSGLVFVSYSSSDRRIAEEIVEYLEAQGIVCWIAPRDISPGLVYGEAIVRALDHSPVVVLVYSHASNVSPQVLREIDRATSADKRIIPVRAEDIMPTGAMEYYIGCPQWLDAFGQDATGYLPRLAKAVESFLTEPTSGEPGNATPPEPQLEADSPQASAAAPEPPMRSAPKFEPVPRPAEPLPLVPEYEAEPGLQAPPGQSPPSRPGYPVEQQPQEPPWAAARNAPGGIPPSLPAPARRGVPKVVVIVVITAVVMFLVGCCVMFELLANMSKTTGSATSPSASSSTSVPSTILSAVGTHAYVDLLRLQQGQARDAYDGSSASLRSAVSYQDFARHASDDVQSIANHVVFAPICAANGAAVDVKLFMQSADKGTYTWCAEYIRENDKWVLDAWVVRGPRITGMQGIGSVTVQRALANRFPVQ